MAKARRMQAGGCGANDFLLACQKGSFAMKVSIEKQWEDFVERLVTEGRYHSAEQVVSAGLSLVAQREAKLNKLRDVIEASIAAGGDIGDEELGVALETRIANLRAQG
jgi:antitoxin ParD1/3/4